MQRLVGYTALKRVLIGLECRRLDAYFRFTSTLKPDKVLKPHLNIIESIIIRPYYSSVQ